MKKPVRILIVDDHFILRMGLIASLKTVGDLSVVGEADNGAQAIQLYRHLMPDVVLMDLRLPDMSGVEATAAIHKEFPKARIMILTSHDLEEDIFRAFQAGALGYLLKDVQVEVLARAIRTVAAGQKHIPPEIARALADHGQGTDLTPREFEVLQMVVKGLSNREIGHALGFSENTAKFHVKNILTKLQVSDRTEAATAALQRGIIR
jgi:two-component system, NarL family, response regulator